MSKERKRYSEAQAREAIEQSVSYSEALRRLGMRPAGGNHRTLRTWAERWGISTAHFDPRAALRGTGRTVPQVPLEAILVEHSTYKRTRLKERLYAAGLKLRVCERCGQGEYWHGRHMALILDHINGNPTDNRLENLQIVCPNCAATLDTHCGRNKPRACAHCGGLFKPRDGEQQHCSLSCSQHSPAVRAARKRSRKATRPPYEQLVREIASDGWSAVGRRYGVSDNAVRKWVRFYEAERAAGNEARRVPSSEAAGHDAAAA